MASHSSILAWRILMDRSLAAYTPWIHKELDMTERLSTQYKPPYIESLSVSQILLSHLSYLRPFSAPATPCLKQSLFHSSNDQIPQFLGSSNVIISERFSSTYKPFLPQTNKQTKKLFSILYPHIYFSITFSPLEIFYVFVNLFPMCLYHWNKRYISIWTISIRFLAIWPASCTVPGLQLAPNMCQSLF